MPLDIPPHLLARAHRELADRAKPGSFAYVGLAIIVAIATDYRTEHRPVIGLLIGLSGLLGIGQLLLSVRFATIHAASPRGWYGGFMAVALGFALVWGAAVAYTGAVFGIGWTYVFMVVLMAGILSGALNGLAPDFGLAVGYVVLLVGPSIGTSAALGGPDGAALAAGYGVFLVYCVAVSREQFRTYRKSLNDAADLELRAQELEATSELAEAASAAKSQFLANMSHEIRTPLNSILSAARLLEGEGLDAAQKKRVETILSAGDSLVVLIGDVLDLAKAEAGRIDVDSRPFRVRSLIGQAVDIVRPQASAKEVDLSYAVASDCAPVILGDPVRLRQILLNLLSNAVKFTEHGTVRVEASVRTAGGRATLQIAVVDTGIGISEEAQSRLFEPFEQADKSATRRFKGTGLGLAISRRLAEAMGGTLDVKSRPGEGATFRLHIPHIAVSKEAGAALDELAASSTGPAGQRPLRVLLAEDNQVNRELTCEIVERLGHRATAVSNGLEVLDALREATFDVVLLDLQMPELDGLSTARRIQEELADSKPCLIALTASATHEQRDQCLAAGMIDFLSKPIEWARLRRTLRAIQSGDEPRVVTPVEEALARSGVTVVKGAREAAKPETGSDALDVDRILHLQSFAKAAEDGFVARLFEVWLERLPELLRGIDEAIARSDAEALSAQAHALKGASANLGIRVVTEASSALEEVGRTSAASWDATAIAPRREALAAAVAVARPEIDRWIARLAKPR